MNIPSYTITPEMLGFLAKIDANREVILRHPPHPTLVDKLNRSSILKSSLFSARIEGNRLDMIDLEPSSQEREQLEIQNILTTITSIDRHITPGKRLTTSFIRKLHSLVMNHLAPDVGRLRTETSAIFNEAGIAVYLTPPPAEIKPSLQTLCRFVNKQTHQFPLITAFMAHLVFEKIHPFIDGNGRVGRLLIPAVLNAQDSRFGVHVPFEEYLENNKRLYYHFLDVGMKEPEEYLTFMLEAFYHQTEDIKHRLHEAEQSQTQLFLPPRQEEIFHLIQEHRMLSFDSLRRRFSRIPERTLRYDLKKMCDGAVLMKIGKTRGSYYTVNRRVSTQNLD